MKTKLIQIIITLMMVIGCKNETKNQLPKLKFNSEKIDLGEINFDSTTKIEFVLYNIGNSELYIDTITSSCGCTNITPGMAKIAATDSLTIKAYFNPVDTGIFNKKIVIKSNIDSSFSILTFYGYAKKKFN